MNTKIQTSKESTNVKNLVENVGEVSYPFCGKVITTPEYDQATHEFRKRMEQAYRDRFGKYRREFEDQLLEQEKKHRLEIETIKKARLQR